MLKLDVGIFISVVLLWLFGFWDFELHSTRLWMLSLHLQCFCPPNLKLNANVQLMRRRFSYRLPEQLRYLVTSKNNASLLSDVVFNLCFSDTFVWHQMYSMSPSCNAAWSGSRCRLSDLALSAKSKENSKWRLDAPGYVAGGASVSPSGIPVDSSLKDDRKNKKH